jgi:hypothetical protein
MEILVPLCRVSKHEKTHRQRAGARHFLAGTPRRAVPALGKCINTGRTLDYYANCEGNGRSNPTLIRANPT